ncbi:MAG TPA: hypothetical protein VM240_09915 [Verrucomicrobiae bacterium]|nr:hypothetical protein [Verrucomicrobiae bacterium]
MHSAVAIANYYIGAAIQQGLATRDFPPSKVHGLVYLAHGWLLGSAGAGVVRGNVMADKDGVFFAELKDAGCWGTRNVTQLVSVIQMDDKRGLMIEQTPQLTPQNPTVAALAWIWRTYGPLSSLKIGEHIRETGGPWEKTWHSPERKGDEARPIAPATMKGWFRNLSSRREDQSHNSKLTRTQQREMKPKVEKTLMLPKKPLK